jgi:hypothetical protein
MGRIRSIKPEFFKHEELFNAEDETGLPLRVAFSGLWTLADREGRFKWKPTQIKLDVLPYDKVDMTTVLDALAVYGFIVKYSSDGKDFGFIPSFKEHQVINHRESPSVIPPPPVPHEMARASRVPTRESTGDDAARGEGKGREGKGREHIQVACAVCAIFGKHYLLPEERLPQTANWFRTIDQQVDKLLEVWKPDEAVKQITAYIRHCDDTGRKRIATDFKVAETILSVNWIGIAAPEPVPKDSNPYSEAEHNRGLWTDEAWRKQYARQIKADAGFREYFKLQTTQ